MKSAVNRLENAGKWVKTHLVAVAWFSLFALVILETLDAFLDNPALDFVKQVSIPLITAVFAACIIEWMTTYQSISKKVNDANTEVFLNIINNGVPDEKLPKDTCKRTAVNSICVACEMDSNDKRVGFVETCVDELCARTHNLLCDEVRVDRTYTKTEFNGAEYLVVKDSHEATVKNYSNHEVDYRAWKNVASGPLGDVPDSISHTLKLKRNVYRKKTLELREYALDKSIEVEDDPLTLERTWVNRELPVKVPPGEEYTIKVNRSFCMPLDETFTNFDWKTSSKTYVFTLSFVGVDVEVIPSITSCTKCGKVDVCNECTKQDNPPCIFENGNNRSSVVISDWIGAQTTVNFKWNYTEDASNQKGASYED